jgi:hypothetical protein
VAMVSLWPGPVKTEFMQENVINSGGHFFLRSSKMTQRGEEHKLRKTEKSGVFVCKRAKRGKTTGSREREREREMTDIWRESKDIKREREREINSVQVGR